MAARLRSWVSSQWAIRSILVWLSQLLKYQGPRSYNLHKWSSYSRNLLGYSALSPYFERTITFMLWLITSHWSTLWTPVQITSSLSAQLCHIPLSFHTTQHNHRCTCTHQKECSNQWTATNNCFFCNDNGSERRSANLYHAITSSYCSEDSLGLQWRYWYLHRYSSTCPN